MSTPWWQDATFNKPAAASLFSYIFRRQNHVVKADFTVALNPPPLASQRGKIRKDAAGELTSRNP